MAVYTKVSSPLLALDDAGKDKQVKAALGAGGFLYGLVNNAGAGLAHGGRATVPGDGGVGRRWVGVVESCEGLRRITVLRGLRALDSSGDGLSSAFDFYHFKSLQRSRLLPLQAPFGPALSFLPRDCFLSGA